MYARVDNGPAAPPLAEMNPASGPQDCGELNYALTMTCIRYDRVKFGALDDYTRAICLWYAQAAPVRYQRINDIIGACECAALELERRVPNVRKFEAVTLRYLSRYVYGHIAVAYEIQKIAENGDIDYSRGSKS
jgi:hypothetical protein